MVRVEEMEQKLNDVVRGIHEERSCSGNSLESDLVGKSLGGNDGEKANRKRSVLPDFVRDGKGFCRAEGSESENRIETMEEGLTEVVSRTSKKPVVEKSLGDKDGEKPDRKSSRTPEFVKDGESLHSPERSESKKVVEETKKKLNNAVRKISKEGDVLGKILVDDVGGKPLGEKDGKKSNRKRSLMPDAAAKVGSEGGQSFEVRGDRLIVLALMAAERCPWMQGERVKVPLVCNLDRRNPEAVEFSVV
ncbi:uncharacterized protein LOC110025150 [Phalaenopsis equestris]|uniref:uncharacterized protein LOC110025150 n=1 Tax=Phalaenopsis equestris TaxID=78828 RepID=UPI0009E49A6E|nr:uncharacterized protein LOC110025150 [Phalaenopsis equestris]